MKDTFIQKQEAIFLKKKILIIRTQRDLKGTFVNRILEEGNFLENDFGPPSPLQSILYILFFDHVAEATGPGACPNRSARPINCLNSLCRKDEVGLQWGPKIFP